MTIEPLRNFLVNSFKKFKKGSFLRALGYFFYVWVSILHTNLFLSTKQRFGDQSSITFRKELNSAHSEVWKHFQCRGFVFGTNQDVRAALVAILNEAAPVMREQVRAICKLEIIFQAWKVFNIGDFVISTEEYLIFLNQQTAPISNFSIPGYKLHSYIFFEQLGFIDSDEINHFTTYSIFDKVNE